MTDKSILEENNLLKGRIAELEESNLKKAYVESTLVQLQQLYLKYKLKYVKLEAKLDAVRPYLQHKHRCIRQTKLNYACDCELAELQAALNGESDEISKSSKNT